MENNNKSIALLNVGIKTDNKILAEKVADAIRGPWTSFNDMHSGGGTKEKWEKIYIQAPEDEAKIIFYNRFGHSADDIVCSCCGENYSVNESEDIFQVTGYERNCEFENDKYIESPRISKYFQYEVMTIAEYFLQKSNTFILNTEISSEERIGQVSRRGWVYVD